jgi:hypothetical protein
LLQPSHIFQLEMLLSDKSKWSFQIIRDNGCVSNETVKEYDLDEDIDDLYWDFQSYRILESLYLNNMKKHIIIAWHH